MIESGSTSRAAGTCRVPTLIHEKRLTVISRVEWCSSRTKVITAHTKLAHTTPVATQPTWDSLMWRPLSSTTRKPSRGSSSISVATCAISALHL